jgi:hypothetical protein
VRGVWAVEPSDVAWKMARTRIAASGVPIQRAGLDGQHLTMPDLRRQTSRFWPETGLDSLVLHRFSRWSA